MAFYIGELVGSFIVAGFAFVIAFSHNCHEPKDKRLLVSLIAFDIPQAIMMLLKMSNPIIKDILTISLIFNILVIVIYFTLKQNYKSTDLKLLPESTNSEGEIIVEDLPKIFKIGGIQITKIKTEKTFKKNKLVRIVLFSILILSLCLNIYQYCLSVGLTALSEQQKEQITSLNNSEEKLRQELLETETMQDKSSKIMLELIPIYLFYRNYAVFTTSTGNSFHKFDCPYRSDDEFWIFNIESAADQGYRPCNHCWKVEDINDIFKRSAES